MVFISEYIKIGISLRLFIRKGFKDIEPFLFFYLNDVAFFYIYYKNRVKMILISEKTSATTIYIPRISTEVLETYVLSLKRGNKTTALTATTAQELNDYRMLTFDTTNLKDGEYTYTLNSGETGLLRVGKITNPTTSYTTNEQEYTYYKG